MIQWVHAGVGILTLLVLCIFLIVYIGIFSTSTTRICGAPLPGTAGDKGEKGIQGKAIFAGITGPAAITPGPTGDPGVDALGVLTGPTPFPAGTGFFTGGPGNTGFPGPPADLLNPINAPPINFKFLNNGVGSDLDQYQDTGYFLVNINCATAAPSAGFASVRFVRLGKNVTFQCKQIVLNHGGGKADWINFNPVEFNGGKGSLQDRFFFRVSQYATTPYVMAQIMVVFDQVPSYFTDGLFKLVIVPNGTDMGTIDSMRIQFRARYSPAADAGMLGPFNAEFSSQWQPGAGQLGTCSEFAINWTLA